MPHRCRPTMQNWNLSVVQFGPRSSTMSLHLFPSLCDQRSNARIYTFRGQWFDQVPRSTVKFVELAFCNRQKIAWFTTRAGSISRLPISRFTHISDYRRYRLRYRYLHVHVILIQAARPIKHKQSNTHKTLKLQLQLQTS